MTATGKNKIDWDLPESILDNLVENFEKYIKDKAIQDPILESNRILNNIGGPEKIDDYLREMLIES